MFSSRQKYSKSALAKRARFRFFASFFLIAEALRATVGNIFFLVGLGVYFYSGNAERPF